ncbi:Heavy metal-associated domain, HMA [Artemisia annua]|uniref:Heavy metal-associated domain, HMA n=1 Tax=Artemisia annua TaxID=35608 RepID=A0A2U1M306_ARTAN|nr:Heavy metal-associated domain, HMA [Artemisia annua]
MDKTNKEVKVISPKPPEAKETLLWLDLHCDGCAHVLKLENFKMAGVKTVSVDVYANVVTVKGTFHPIDLENYTWKVSGRPVMIGIPKSEKDKYKDYLEMFVEDIHLVIYLSQATRDDEHAYDVYLLEMFVYEIPDIYD